MKKELIWNISLLLSGLFIAFLITAFPTLNSWNLNIAIGWTQGYPSPFGLINKWQLGLFMGSTLVVFRYIQMAILKINPYDFKLLVLIISYFLPILLVLIWVDREAHFVMSETMDNIIPTQSIQLEINELRSIGFFKKYSKQGEIEVTDLVVGRFLRSQDGQARTHDLFDSNHQISVQRLLRFDYDKVWGEGDTEWVVEGNRAYEDFIKKLSAISEGNIQLDSVNEQWLSKEKIKITLSINNKLHDIYPKVQNDRADTQTILAYLNQLLNDNKTDFQYYYISGNDILIIGLTQSEKENLIKKYNFNIQNPLNCVNCG